MRVERMNPLFVLLIWRFGPFDDDFLPVIYLFPRYGVADRLLDQVAPGNLAVVPPTPQLLYVFNHNHAVLCHEIIVERESARVHDTRTARAEEQQRDENGAGDHAAT